jgi:hypothetical protein
MVMNTPGRRRPRAGRRDVDDHGDLGVQEPLADGRIERSRPPGVSSRMTSADRALGLGAGDRAARSAAAAPG